MTFEIYSQTEYSWVDITPYIAFQGMEGTRNDVDGPNAGRVIKDARMDRDRRATKYKWTFTTPPISINEAGMIEALLMPEFFNVRTDYFSPGTVKQYECYSNNVAKSYILNRVVTGSEEPLVKLSFPIVER